MALFYSVEVRKTGPKFIENPKLSGPAKIISLVSSCLIRIQSVPDIQRQSIKYMLCTLDNSTYSMFLSPKLHMYPKPNPHCRQFLVPFYALLRTEDVMILRILN